MSLAGKRVLVTRAAGQAADLARELEARGASVVIVPVLEIADPESFAPLDTALRSLASYRAVAFTSANAVERFFTRFYDVLGTCDVAALPEGTRAFAVGPKTAEALARAGIEASALAEDSRGEALARAIKDTLGDVKGVRVLLPRAAAGREELPDGLRAAGARVDAVPVYRTTIPPGAESALRAALAEKPDAITFASPSAASHAVELTGVRALAGIVIAAIGPTTAARVVELGLEKPVVAEKATARSLAEALSARFR